MFVRSTSTHLEIGSVPGQEHLLAHAQRTFHRTAEAEPQRLRRILGAGPRRKEKDQNG